MLIDAHLHLDKYGDLLDEALKQIETERIFTVATAMDVPSYLEMRKIGERCELVLPTFGIHPRRAADHASRLPELGRNIETSLAIGEIALDFHWVKDTSTYSAQRKVNNRTMRVMILTSKARSSSMVGAGTSWKTGMPSRLR